MRIAKNEYETIDARQHAVKLMPVDTENSTERVRSIGSGTTTRDGCSVDLYLRLPYHGEVELMRPWMPAAASVLELGCAVGRMTRELLAQGYRVTAVDNSPDMLAHVPTEASRVCADIESLDLGRTFDAVIFASCLINIPDETLRAAQLDKCRAHLRPGGRLLFERHDPAWLSNVTVGYVGITGPIEIFIDEARRVGNEVALCCRYQQNEDSWLHRFSARILDDAAVRDCLLNAGFEPPIWIDRRWGVAAARELGAGY